MKEVSTAGKPLTAFHLKMAALITMVIDHTAAALTLPRGVDTLMRSIGRMAFPIYAFFIAEGCRYTRSRERYMLVLQQVQDQNERQPLALVIKAQHLRQQEKGKNGKGRQNIRQPVRRFFLFCPPAKKMAGSQEPHKVGKDGDNKGPWTAGNKEQGISPLPGTTARSLAGRIS